MFEVLLEEQIVLHELERHIGDKLIPFPSDVKYPQSTLGYEVENGRVVKLSLYRKNLTKLPACQIGRAHV